MNFFSRAFSSFQSCPQFGLLLGFGVLLISAEPTNAATITIELAGGGTFDFECSNLYGGSQAIWSFAAFPAVIDYDLNVSFSVVDPFPVRFRKPDNEEVFVDAGDPVRAATRFPTAFIWGTLDQTGTLTDPPETTSIGSRVSPVSVPCT